MGDPASSELIDQTQRLLNEISAFPTKNGFSDPFSGSLIRLKGPLKRKMFSFAAGDSIIGEDSHSPNYSFGGVSSESKQPWVASEQTEQTAAMCQVCCLVEAEIRCAECNQTTCAFCDFQAHKVMPVAHMTRVSLRVPNANDSIAKRAAQAKTVAESARLLQNGASLDDTILEFFKTEEFKKVVNKAAHHDQDVESTVNALEGDDSFLPRSNASAGGYLGRSGDSSSGTFLGRSDSIGKLLGRADSIGQGLLGRANSTGQTLGDEFLELMDLPLMEPWPKKKRGNQGQPQGGSNKRPRAGSTASRKVEKAWSGMDGLNAASAVAASSLANKAPRAPAKLKEKAAKEVSAAELRAEAAAALMQKRPRPTDYIFQMKSKQPQLAEMTKSRNAAHARFKEKKKAQLDNPKVRYKSRKKIADNRPRVKGRFVKTSELVTAGGIEAWKKANAGKFT